MTYNTVFLLSNTSSRYLRAPVQATAVRRCGDLELVSLITNGNISYTDLLEYISTQTESVFVDVEKKQELGLGSHQDFAGNLYKRILEATNKTVNPAVANLKIYPIKTNDITISALLDACFHDYKDVSGMTAAIIGMGNLGFKSALSLTESGVHVKAFNRTTHKTFVATEAITYFKPHETISSPENCLNYLHAFVNSDFSVIASSNLSLPIEKISNIVKENHTMYVFGHSIFSEKSLNTLHAAGIRVVRIDVSRALMQFVQGKLSTTEFRTYGSIIKKGVALCSGGFVGDGGTYIVDDYRDPQILLGECDGQCGMLTAKTNDLNLTRIEDYDPPIS